MSHFWKSLLRGSNPYRADIAWINERRGQLAKLADSDLQAAAEAARDLLEIFAVAAAAGARLLGLAMFDV